jgi:hypothetical protein
VIPASAQVEVRIGLVAPTHRDLWSAGASAPIFIRGDGARAMGKSGAHSIVQPPWRRHALGGSDPRCCGSLSTPGEN